MESGSNDDPFYILSLIIDRLEIATSKLKQSKIDECLNAALDLPFHEIKIEKSEKADLRKAIRLMSMWYGYINALTNVGDRDCIVIHIDEVEDRWLTPSITSPQLERDLKYLRDLLGYIQKDSMDQKFPVALFLYMTEGSYQHIGGVNNALKTRLERTIFLQPFTEDNAMEFVKNRLKERRIDNRQADEFNPFTQEGILILIKKSKDDKGLFFWRKFIISCHDILFYYSRRGGGIIDKTKVNEWLTHRSTSPLLPPTAGTSPGSEPSADPFDDIDFQKMGRDRADKLTDNGFLENKELQLQHAIKNISRVIHDCSNHFSIDKSGKLVFSIPGEKAKIPLSLKMANEAKTKSDYFCIFVTNDTNKVKNIAENEFTLKLSDSPNMMIRYALYEPGLISSGDLTKAKDQISKQVSELNDKLSKLYEKYKNDHYIPQLFGSRLQSEENFESFIIELHNLSKCDLKKVNVDSLTDWGFFDGASFTIPRWYTQMVSLGMFNPKDLWSKVFFFNLESKPIEAAVKLLKKLEIIDGMQLRHFEDRKSILIKKIEANSKEIENLIDEMKKGVGENQAKSFISKTKSFIKQLKEIKAAITSFKATDNIFGNFMELYLQEVHFKNVSQASEAYVSAIKEISTQYNNRKKTIDSALTTLSDLKIRDPELERKLTETLTELNGVFERTDMISFMRISKQTFDELIAEYNQFHATSTQLLNDIKNFNISQLTIAAEKGLIDEDKAEIKNAWTFIQDSENLNEVQQRFLKMRNHYATLEILAGNHKNHLSTKFSEGNILLKNCEQYLSEEQLEKIGNVILIMGNKIESVNTCIRKGELIESLKITVDLDFESLGPILKSMFNPEKDYTIDSIENEFNLDKTRAKNFIKFLEENKVLIPTYRIAK